MWEPRLHFSLTLESLRSSSGTFSSALCSLPRIALSNHPLELWVFSKGKSISNSGHTRLASLTPLCPLWCGCPQAIIANLFLLLLTSAQLCPTLCDLMDCSPPGSSVHGILQVRVPVWLLCPPPGHLPDPEMETVSLMPPALTDRLFILVPPGKPLVLSSFWFKHFAFSFSMYKTEH